MSFNLLTTTLNNNDDNDDNVICPLCRSVVNKIEITGFDVNNNNAQYKPDKPEFNEKKLLAFTRIWNYMRFLDLIGTGLPEPTYEN